MSENTIKREDILGDAAKTFTFDKALRGYDTKQVDDYINSLIKSNKNAIEIINSRIGEMKTDNEMLRYELEQSRSELDDALQANATLRSEMQKMTVENTKANAAAAAAAVAANKSANDSEIKELEEKIKKLTTRNRLLADENKKLEDEKKDMQRDIAHLTKKVDKSRSKGSQELPDLDVGDEVVVDGLCRLDREEGGGREPDGGIHALASEEGDGTDARVDDDAFTVGCLRREDYAASAAYVGGLDVLGLLDQLFKVGG